MPRTRTNAADARRLGDRLRALANDAARGRELAAEIAFSSTDPLLLNSALTVLSRHATDTDRPALLDAYAWLDADGPRRDAGGYLRRLALEALRRIAVADDLPLLQRAVTTNERSMQEGTGVLRAAALLAIDALDPELAAQHAARLLTEEAEGMSGEPAVTAARYLGGAGQPLPLLAFALTQSEAVPDVVAECVRGLETLDTTVLVAGPLDAFALHPAEIVTVALIDLLIAHASDDRLTAFLARLLRQAGSEEVLHFALTSIVASRRDDLLAEARTLAAEQVLPARRRIFEEALRLAPPEGSPPRRR